MFSKRAQLFEIKPENLTFLGAIDAMRNGNLQQVQKFLNSGELKLNRNEYCVSVILKKLPDPAMHNDYAFIAWLHGLYSGYLDIVKKLWKEEYLERIKKIDNGETPFLVAASREYLDIMQWLIKENKANINEHDNTGKTALMFAASRNNLKLTQWLVANGASLDHRDRGFISRNAFEYAVNYNHHDVARFFVRDCGINPLPMWAWQRADPPLKQELEDMWYINQHWSQFIILFNTILITSLQTAIPRLPTVLGNLIATYCEDKDSTTVDEVKETIADYTSYGIQEKVVRFFSEEKGLHPKMLLMDDRGRRCKKFSCDMIGTFADKIFPLIKFYRDTPGLSVEDLLNYDQHLMRDLAFENSFKFPLRSL